MFNNMGMPKGEMALYTGLLYLPWVIKPFWSPFVDMLRTKRWWVVAMQIIMSAAFALAAFSLPQPSPHAIASGSVDVSLFSVTLVLFWITAFASATHDIAADGLYMLALEPGDQSLFVGIRSTFYRFASIFGQGVLVMIAGVLEERGDVPRAWAAVMLLSAVMFAILTLWHTFRLPRPDADAMRKPRRSAKEIFREFGHTFATFFSKKHVWVALAFMLLYRLPEALIVKMMNPFLLDSHAEGGLALSTETVGMVYGTVGTAALTVGGILGGVAASRWGLKKSLWPMSLSLILPCLSFVFLAIFQPESILLISFCVALDQFGYGFGFTAYMLYQMYFPAGEYKTAHYSLCTGFMALSMMLPGMFAGYLQEAVGYVHFFGIVIVCCLATVIVTMMLKVDPEYGKKN